MFCFVTFLLQRNFINWKKYEPLCFKGFHKQLWNSKVFKGCNWNNQFEEKLPDINEKFLFSFLHINWFYYGEILQILACWDMFVHFWPLWAIIGNNLIRISHGQMHFCNHWLLVLKVYKFKSFTDLPFEQKYCLDLWTSLKGAQNWQPLTIQR